MARCCLKVRTCAALLRLLLSLSRFMAKEAAQLRWQPLNNFRW